MRRAFTSLLLVGAAALLPALPARAADAPAPSAAEPAASAATPGAAQVAEPALQIPGADELLEPTRRSLRSTAEWLASGVDSWFGDTPFENGGKVSDGQMTLGYFKRQDQDTQLRLRFNARFRLPNIERRTYLFVGRDDERLLVTDAPEGFARTEALLNNNTRDNAFFAGLGLPLLQSLDMRLGFRGGLKLYAQARLRQPWQFAPTDRIEFRETLFWTVADHFGSTAVLSYEHVFTPTLVGRWLNSATITQALPHYAWSSSVGLYVAPRPQRQLALELLAGGQTDSGIAVANYGLQAKWAQPLHKDWLRAEFLLGHFWPRDDLLGERRRAWAGGATVTLGF